MKRFVFLSSLAVVSAVACTKTEFTPVANGEAQIVFNSPIVQLNTKANVYGEQPVGGKYSTGEHFKVYAVWTSGNYETSDWSKPYMKGVEVGYNSSLGGDASNAAKGAWEPATAYYWPKNGYLTFAGYSPADLANKATTPSSPKVSYGAAGLVVENFEVDPDPAKQFDFMYAERSYNRKSSTNESKKEDGHTYQSYDGVDLMFHHALSSIVFKVNADNTLKNTKFTLKSIKIKNAQYKGNFAERIKDGKTYESLPAWTNDPAVTNYTAYSKDYEVPAAENYAEFVKPTGISDIILLPQAFKHKTTDEVTVVISYELETNGVTLSEQTAEFKLSNYKASDSSTVSAWEMGRRYIYKIYFTLDKIYFSPEVIDWKNVDMEPFDVI